MSIKKLRLERGWSQQQLADISGISGRTIQRIENGANAGLDSQNALAAAFGLSLSDLQIKLSSYAKQDVEEKMDEQVNSLNWKGFFIHLAVYMAVISWIAALSHMMDWSSDGVLWAALVWANMLLLHLLKLINKSEADDQ
ncbi:helix-turn-helix domain-containing protein [Kordiimonas laminariae]|uniref:helix-turn-helix domain-containing protein n=1 Tax=Kordiimonas laminariae TaxID=2917717 RepID=UPI001FF614F0|nr:helix-turn-helix domain-containing protein [Kordiimonas laminariae]MCK0069276.1 helix-turn-helix domain-containing protein [Kordiimonas laminariae]